MTPKPKRGPPKKGQPKGEQPKRGRSCIIAFSVGGSATLYFGLLLLYWPTLAFQPLALDDQRQLAHAVSAQWGLLAPDPFGHVRPVKQLLFQVAAGADPAALRAGILVLLLGCVALVQWHAARVSGSQALGLAVAACFGLNPTMASVGAWLSAVNVLIGTGLVVVYLEMGERAGERAVGRGRVALAAAWAALVLAGLSYEIALLAPIALWVRSWMRGAITPTPGNRRAIWIGSALCVAAILALRVTAASAAAPIYRSAAEPPLLLAASSARYLFENGALWLFPWHRFGVLLTDDPSQQLLASALSHLEIHHHQPCADQDIDRR